MTNQACKVLHTLETIQIGINGVTNDMRKKEYLTSTSRFLLDCTIQIVEELKKELKQLKE